MKRMRGPNFYEVMDTKGDFKNKEENKQKHSNSEVEHSGMDCLTSCITDLAKLAQQASHQP